MKKTRFTDQLIEFALQQHESGKSVAEISRKPGVAEQAYYRWKKRFSGLAPSEVRRLRQLEGENKRLKQMVTDLSLDRHMLQEVIR
jgi:putative transposase